MKQKDLAVIIGAAFLSGVFALLLSTLFVSSKGNSNQTAEVVQPIVADFPEPDKKYFNSESIDPTQLIRIGDSTNPTPFNDN
jgi:hypothetical protein